MKPRLGVSKSRIPRFAKLGRTCFALGDQCFGFLPAWVSAKGGQGRCCRKRPHVSKRDTNAPARKSMSKAESGVFFGQHGISAGGHFELTFVLSFMISELCNSCPLFSQPRTTQFLSAEPMLQMRATSFAVRWVEQALRGFPSRILFLPRAGNTVLLKFWV